MADAVHRGAAWSVGVGAAVTFFALSPPVDRWADTSLAGHMIQHSLLLVVVAPLLALGICRAERRPTHLFGPIPTAVATVARRLDDAARHHVVTTALMAATVQSLVIGLWHLPVLYDAAVRHGPVHALEHASYLVAATAFWWTVIRPAPARRGGALGGLFLSTLTGIALGAAMFLAGRPWYTAYPSLADQQLAGMVMWGVTGLPYVIAAVVVAMGSLRALELTMPSARVVVSP